MVDQDDRVVWKRFSQALYSPDKHVYLMSESIYVKEANLSFIRVKYSTH